MRAEARAPRAALISRAPTRAALVLLAPALAALVLLAPTRAGAADCAWDAADLRQGPSSLRFQVEVADDAAERNQGLMFRESLGRFEGMLFVYDRPQQAVSFWMKNTLIPLDMLFFDASGRLISLQENAAPGDLTPLPGGEATQFVLEINGGAARRLGVSPGAELRHPAVDPALAAWPCG